MFRVATCTHWLRTRLGLCLAIVLLIGLWRPTKADEADQARELLMMLERGQEDRAQTTQELIAIAPRTISAIGDFLARDRTSSIDQRRAVLRAIKASIPDKSGRFETPSRQKADQVRADDDFDWLTALGKLPTTTPGLGDVFADIAALRALAATDHVDAAQIIFEVGFAEPTILYRDECGRRLRAMAPYSLPTLTKASQVTHKATARYSTYQLERLDRQEPGKAVDATAADEDLRVALLRAFGESHHREAVGTVLRYTNDESWRVRPAARDAWLAYVTGPPPKPAPTKRLQLPGGKLADEETPLWLTYRERAEIELKRTAEEHLGSVFTDGEVVDLEALSRDLFGYYDGVRRKREDAAFATAMEGAQAGDLVGAALAFDRLLAENPQLPQRADAAPIYLALAAQHAKAEDWNQAAAAYGKAFGVAPHGAQGVDAEAGHEYALGKAIEAAGKDGGAHFRRAVALKPDYAPAQEAAARTATPADRPWLLYAAVAGALLALGFLGAGLVLRRR
jgi:hypothetical protein